jgi:Flp pilus assembly protein TadG
MTDRNVNHAPACTSGALGIGAFVRGRRGSVLTWGALMMVPLIGFMGLGVDTARGYLVRARLSQSLDAAALAAGRQTADTKKAEDMAKTVFKANFPNGYMDAALDGPTVTFNADKDTVTASATVVMPTYFVRLIGQDNFTVSASTEVTRKTVYMDVVVSIDVSGSMGDYIAGVKKVDAASTAARTLVDSLYGTAEEKDLLKMGLVTWNSNARILDINSTYKRNQATSKAVASYDDPTTTSTSKKTTVWFAKNSPVPLFTRPADGWKGCVHARFLGTGNEANNADLFVSTGKFGTKDWVAWKPAFNNSDGQEMQCPSQGIQRLTSVRGQMISAIQQVKNPSGNTDLAVGLIWGWSLLGISGSPFTGDGTTPPAQGEGQLIRAIVLMTDGANTQDNQDAYQGALTASKLDDRTKIVAKRIKDEGVVIYGIQFGYKSGPQEALMKEVASGPGAPYYQYAPDAESLKAAFQEIGNHLTKLRISK